MDAIKMIVGLGNPGPEYSRTRHNAGFWFIDALAEKHQARWGLEKKLHAETAKITVAGQLVHLLKPATFMNHSGRAVLAASNRSALAGTRGRPCRAPARVAP